MRMIAGLSLSAMALVGPMAGWPQAGVANASNRDANAVAKDAAVYAAKAGKALAKGDTLKAVGFAEMAVSAMPQDAGYRALLGATYLKAGRFTSAHAAYADVLQMRPDDGKAALNLALAMIAEGQWGQARSLLESNAAVVPASDRGLAIALAGDPATGVELLIAAARSPDADAKTRQNLALALALAGRWNESRQLAGVDLPPLQADARIVQWAAFAKPVGAADQVSALLGVTPTRDPGLPIALALNRAIPGTAMAAIEPVARAEWGEAPGSVPVADLATRTSEIAAPPMTGGSGKVIFGERREIVQPLPTKRPAGIASPHLPNATLAAAPMGAAPAAAQPGAGKWFVQLGAYGSVANAKEAWDHAQRRYVAFAEQEPTGMTFKSFYRLSVGGYSRSRAEALCRGYRAEGGSCFVRTSAGDQVAQWVKPTKVLVAGR